MPMVDVSLSTVWWPAQDRALPRYVFTLRNDSPAALHGFALHINGHGKIDPAGSIENATLVRALSNYFVVTPPAGRALAPGASWQFIVRGTNLPFRHWTEAASAASIVSQDGSWIDVAISPCAAGDAGQSAPRWDRRWDRGALTDGLALVPWPNHTAVCGAIAASAGLCPMGADAPAIAAFADLAARLFPDETLLADDGFPVRLTRTDLAHDAYRLDFAATAVTLSAGGDAGFLAGLISLGQILRGARHDPAQCRFPAAGHISDAPHYAWRGCHLDVSRQFYPLAELERFLAILAWNKINRFHLHLTDDEAWRFEVHAFPDLTAIGAWRGHGLAIPPLLGSGPARYGGCYTQDQLRALVALAERFHIVIVPEIDVPGHCFAALAALPWLRDPNPVAAYRSIQGFANNCLSPTLPAALRFVETVLAELLAVFPSPWVHIGADEVPDGAWGPDTPAIQAAFLRQVQGILQRARRITTAWDEGAQQGGIAPSHALLMAWQNPALGPALARAGYDVVMTPAALCYLNMATDPDWWAPGASWAGHSPVAATYDFDPAAGFAAPELSRLTGVQACIWSEQMADRRVFGHLVFPRLSALAETGWTRPERKSWTRFAAAARLMPMMFDQAPLLPL